MGIFDGLRDRSRLVITTSLAPVGSPTFQATGFEGGASAAYESPDGSGTCIVIDTHQSVANRLERAVWDEAAGDFIEPLRGLPFVRSTMPDGALRSSVLESHRMASPYISGPKVVGKARDVMQSVQGETSFVDALLGYDPMSLVFGCFAPKATGSPRVQRAYSGEIVGYGASQVVVGGSKTDRDDPAGTRYGGGGSQEGLGNVLFTRTRWVAREILVHTHVDLSLIRSYRLSEAVEDMLLGVAMLAHRRWLRDGLRLRSECIFDVAEDGADAAGVPSLEVLEAEVPGLIAANADRFADPCITDVVYEG